MYIKLNYIMCFEKRINGTKIPESSVAEKDIKVYKIIDNKNLGMCYDLHINGKKYKWKPGYWYSETTPFHTARMNPITGWLEIEGHALHSCKTLKEARKKLNFFNDVKMVKMIIPKGALYYENNREYVSDQLIYPK